MRIFQLNSQPEEKKVIEDRLQDINNDMDKASKIQTNLKTLLGE